jgi:sialate O-acetylesterase
LLPKLQEGDLLCDAYASKVEAWEKLYQQAVSSARKAGGPTPLPPPLPEGDPRRADFQRPTFLYNGMVAPLTRFPIKGIIFYHGENHANPEKAPLYDRLFPALITDWRRAWQRPNLPFLYVQLANHRRTTWEALCEVREAQRQALAIPHTGMAVAIDVGDVSDVHCKNKQEIARRLALIARAQVYGEALEYSGPVVDTVTFAENQVQVTFTHADSLCFQDGKALGLEVAGADGVYHVATGEIQGNKLLVSSLDVSAPASIRYAWRDTPEVSLFNAAKLPASPFRAAKTVTQNTTP